jgi:mycofactocin precursor
MAENSTETGVIGSSDADELSGGEETLLTSEMLVEEVSIDGMCGVY